MGKLGEKFVNWIRRKYEKKNVPWEKSDDIIWKFWAYCFPIIAFIPILFWLLKKIMIDYLLAKKGFEEAVMYIAIILILRPMIMDVFTKIADLKKKSKE